MSYFVDFETASLEQLIVHRVGNKAREEGCLAAKQALQLTEELEAILRPCLLGSLSTEACYRFNHESDLELNEVFNYVRTLFEDESAFEESSVKLLQHLYQCSEHANVKNGEFYVARFANCLLEDEYTEAIGLFKAEQKRTFLRVALNSEGELSLEYEHGTEATKLDKGCLIFNTEGEDGYRVLSLQLKNADAKYWKDDFLKITQIQDPSFRTQNCLQMCKSFSKELLEETEDKQAQINFINKSISYFEEKESFDLEEFAQEVFEEAPERAEQFKTFKKDYEEKRGIVAEADEDPALAHFYIAPSAVQKAKRSLRSLIQLDTQLEIRLQNPQAESFIEKAYDESRKMHYYKVYFNNEK